HGVTPFRNGAVGFQDHRENIAGRHELGEFTKKWARFVYGIKAARFFLGEAHRFDRHDDEARLVYARENFPLLRSVARFSLDDCEGAFETQESFLILYFYFL